LSVTGFEQRLATFTQRGENVRKFIRAIVVKAAVLAAVLLLGATAAHVQAFPPARLPSESAAREAMMRSLQKLNDHINDFIAAAANAGFSQVLAKGRVEMNQNGAAELPVRLDYGNAYAVAARCVGNCRVRLVLKDASGKVVKSDDHLNDKPAFVFRPNWTGEYTLSVELVGCGAGNCQVGAVILAQPDDRPKLWRDVFTDTIQATTAI
jgi:hypothetical protein